MGGPAMIQSLNGAIVPNAHGNAAMGANTTWGVGYYPGTLVVQRKELTGIPQLLFPGLGVTRTGDAVPSLAPCGELDRPPLRVLGSFGGEDDLQQSPDVRQRQTGLGFFSPDAVFAGPRTKAPT
jgi:hypothetical protein